MSKKRRIGVFVEGLDGSGKSHLVKEIYQQLIFQSAENPDIPKVGWIKFPTFRNEESHPMLRDFAYLKDMITQFQSNYSIQDCEILICDRGPLSTAAYSKTYMTSALIDYAERIFGEFFDQVLLVHVPISPENAVRVIARRDDPADCIPSHEEDEFAEWAHKTLELLRGASSLYEEFFDLDERYSAHALYYKHKTHKYEAWPWEDIDQDIYENRTKDASNIVSKILSIIGESDGT